MYIFRVRCKSSLIKLIWSSNSIKFIREYHNHNQSSQSQDINKISNGYFSILFGSFSFDVWLMFFDEDSIFNLLGCIYIYIYWYLVNYLNIYWYSSAIFTNHECFWIFLQSIWIIWIYLDIRSDTLYLAIRSSFIRHIRLNYFAPDEYIFDIHSLRIMIFFTPCIQTKLQAKS